MVTEKKYRCRKGGRRSAKKIKKAYSKRMMKA
jgi:hypothetical protein